MSKCNFCNKQFQSKYVLARHQKTTKYCLKIQGKTSEKCSGCQKEFNSCTLSSHKEKCVQYNIKKIEKKYQSIIEEQARQICELQNKLGDVAIKAAIKPITINQTQNNLLIQNFDPITTKLLRNHAKNFEKKHITNIENPASAYVNFLAAPLKDKILVTDINRCNAKYKNSKGVVVTDPGMSSIIRRCFLAIKDRNTELLDQYHNEVMKKWNIHSTSSNGEMDEEEAKNFSNVSDSLLAIAKSIRDLKSDVILISQGGKPRIYYDIRRGLCEVLKNNNVPNIEEFFIDESISSDEEMYNCLEHVEVVLEESD